MVGKGSTIREEMQLNSAEKNRVIISVGSNIDPEINVKNAAELISVDHDLLFQSEFAFTKPVGFQEQDDFLNGAFLVETALNQEEFNRYLKSVENQLGRVKTEIKSGPRTIDLDIIIWNGSIVHSDYKKRDYVRRFVDQVLKKYSIEISG